MAYLRLDSQAFLRNLQAIRARLSPQATTKAPELALVLKDNAYGHGLKEISSLAQRFGIESVFVKNNQEALSIAGSFRTITALYGEVPKEAPANIWASIPSLSALQSYTALDTPRTIELKVDIGMHRNGIAQADLPHALRLLDSAPHITLGGVFAHNGYGDNDDCAFLDSLRAFAAVKQELRTWCTQRARILPRFHSLSTSGALRLYAEGAEGREEVGDLVRIGIGAYGYHTSDVPLPIQLSPVASLFAKRISTLHLKKGDRIGYGGVSVVKEEGVYSTYDLGYGDGLFRIGSAQEGLCCASGEKILPVMSMDCFSCAGESEEVCVFRDASEWARAFGTITYVILTHLSPSLPRVVV